MKTNNFDNIYKLQTKIKNERFSLEARTKKYLLSVSDDHRGNDLDEFFSKKDAKLCVDFLDFMKKHGYPGAVNLKLERFKYKRALSESKISGGSWAYSRLRRLANKSRWLVIWSGRGYDIGIFASRHNISYSIPNSLRVFLCTDGKLRCKRSPVLFAHQVSYASGFGRIPNDKSLLGDYLVITGRFQSSDAKTPDVPFKHAHIAQILEDYVKGMK